MTVELTVVGSINLDLVARVRQLPRPGETVAAHQFERNPGGKGANQAVAAARLDAKVRLIGAVGEDDLADEALTGLVAAGVELELERAGQTGLALILVDDAGENEIAVVPGANGLLTPREVEGAVLCQLEVPDEVVLAAAAKASFFALNAAPARPIDVEPDLLVVNRLEHGILSRAPHDLVSRGRLVAVTRGADGAVLYEGGRQVAESASPEIVAKDGTGAGDAFTACLVVSLLEGRSYQDALRRSCTAGAYAASTPGAQSSAPHTAQLEALLRA